MSWVLLTGASSGIGLELAREFAAGRWNLVLAARNEDAMRRLASELQSAYGVECRVLSADLADRTAAEALFEKCKDLEIEALVNNAGFGAHGYFAKLSLKEQEDMVQVNIMSLMSLTHLFVNPMLRRGRGMILNVGSVAAFQPGPTMNVYYATKSFVYSFSYSLAKELEGTGVTVTVLNPGTTRTKFFERSGAPIRRPFKVMDAREVARAGYRAAMAGKRSVTPGWMNRVMAAVSPALPSALTSSIVRWLHRSR